MSDEKNDSNGLPAFAIQYVQQVLRKMRYHRKVQDEDEAELIVHFEDELEDCKIDEEK